MDTELLHFRYSPYNEKVRWALDLMRVPHRRQTLLPGPHMSKVRRLTGQTATPVLRIDGRWLAGSSVIIEVLDNRFGDPSLYPADPQARRAAIDLERRFDEDLGPRMRRALLSTLLTDGSYLTRLFGGNKPWLTRALYRLTFPIAKSMIAKGNGITGPESIEDGHAANRSAFDLVAEQSARTGYLIGDTLTIADLTAAAMLATVVDMPGTPMERPTPRPAALVELMDQWASHPGAEWTRQMYARHRGRGQPDDGVFDYGRSMCRTG
jgi:glutathione S-transferase